VGIAITSLAKPSRDDRVYEYNLGIVLGVVTAFGRALLMTLTRKLKSVDTTCLMFNHMAIGTVFMLTLLMTSPYEPSDSFVYDQGSTYWYLMLGGVANCVGIFYSTYNNQHSKPTTVVLFRYIGIFYSFLIDLFVFNESFNFL